MRRDPSEPIIARIDRDRRSGAAKARDAAISVSAYQVVRDYLNALPANDIDRAADGILDATRDALTAHLDAAGASSAIAAKAYQPITAPTAKERAGAVFSRANDRGTR